MRCDEWVTVGGRQRVDEPGVYDVWARTSDAVTVIDGVARVAAPDRSTRPDAIDAAPSVDG